jgi:putative peptide zinc metalloprotease protein
MQAVLPGTPLEAPQLSPRDAELAGVIPARLRVDIIVRRQTFKNEEYYVLKDPLALTYFRLQPEEAYVISQLDGKRSLLEIQTRLVARYPNSPRTLEELAMFVNQLSAGGLLNQNAGRFVENARRPKPQGLIALWAAIIGKVLFFKIPLVDPSPWLGGLVRAVNFIWTPWFVGGAIAFILWSIGLVLANLDEFSAGVPDFFSATNLGLLYIAIIIAKTLHEFGHATTCRRFGGEVHEMGVCFMFFTPCGYVDASDAWMMRKLRQKVYVTLSGVFSELIVAAIAAHFFIFLPDGLARGIAFNLMLVASVNTIVFNANPLMRFDGYYLACDLLEIPNLRNKAIAYVSFQLQRIFLGYRNRQQEESFVHDSQATVFIVYAIAAYAYMIFIIYGVTQIFAAILEPYGLHDFGLSLGIFVEVSFVAFPILKVIHDVMKPGAHIEKTGSATRRLSLLIGGLALAVAASFYVPTRYSVTQQAIAMAAVGEWVAPEVAGTVTKVHVRTGQWVQVGDVLITLSSPEATAELEIAQSDLASARLEIGALQRRSDWIASEGLAQASQNLEIAETSYRRAVERVERLTLRATVAGYVLTPEPEKRIGSFASPQTPLLRIADTREMRLVIPLTEDQAQLVEAGGRVEGRWIASARPIETRIESIANQPASLPEVHFGMLSYFGGPAPSQILQANSGFHFPLFLASAPLPSGDHQSVEGLRLRVTIEGRSATVAERVGRWFYSLFKIGGAAPRHQG